VAATTLRGRRAAGPSPDEAFVMDTGFAGFSGSLTGRSLRGLLGRGVQPRPVAAVRVEGDEPRPTEETMTTPSDPGRKASPEPVDLSKGEQPADEPFDPYRFGKPEHPIPAEYAPPGYAGPVTPPPAPYAPPGPWGGPPPSANADNPFSNPPGSPYSANSGQPGYPPTAPGAGPYPPPGYYPTPPGYGYGQPRPGSGKAVAALVLGIGSIVFCWFSFLDAALVIPGVIFGLIAMGETKGSARSGRGMAVAGLVCSVVGAVLATIFTVLLVHAANACGGFDNGSAPNFQTCLREHVF